MNLAAATFSHSVPEDFATPPKGPAVPPRPTTDSPPSRANPDPEGEPGGSRTLPGVAESLADRGWCLLPEVVDGLTLGRLRTGMDEACERARAIQVRNGVEAGADGTLHHLPCHDAVFLEFLGHLHLDGEIRNFLEGNYILNSFGGVINRKEAPSYVCRVHRDIRTFTGDLKLMLNLLVMVDDFTIENGATHFLSGSHRQAHRPSDEDFHRRADRAVGRAGSVVLFDSNLWHAAGENLTPEPRRALTLTFTRPFLKPQFDYPRYFGYEAGDSFPEPLVQLLGYHARIPASLDEWYQPPESRMYRPGQG